MDRRGKKTGRICHALRCAGYVSLLPYLAYMEAARYASCIYVPIGLFDLLLPVITFALIVGYGSILSGKFPRRALPAFWVANIFFTYCHQES